MAKLGSKSAYWYVPPADLLTTVCVASPKLTRADTCLQMLSRENARTSTLAKLKQVWFSLYLWLSATKAPGITYKTHVRSLQKVQRRQMDPRTQGIAQQGVPGFLVCLMNLNRVLEIPIHPDKKSLLSPAKEPETDRQCLHSNSSSPAKHHWKQWGPAPAGQQKLSEEPRLVLYHHWAVTIPSNPPFLVIVE